MERNGASANTEAGIPLGVVVELGGGDGSCQVRDGLERFRALGGSGAKRVATIYIDDTRFRPGREINTVQKRMIV